MITYDESIVIRIAGEGGEGVISAGELLALALMRASLEVYTFRTYPAEIKGGPAMIQIRIGNKPVLSQGDALDVLLAFNAEACRNHRQDLRQDGLLIYDPADFDQEAISKFRSCPVPLTQIASTEIGQKLTKNMVALGSAARALALPAENLEELIRSRFRRKSEEIQAKNVQAVHAGFNYAGTCDLRNQCANLPEKGEGGKILTSGNDALSMGALAAGCRYYAGYPITPASDIMERLAAELPKFGGSLLQTEDEIAAISSVLGASYAGVKSMTATSGPGLSLMVEMIGYGVMAEIPAVIVDAQRAGPSTGMPTKTEQSDLNLAIYGGHGDAARIVLAPGDVEDCFYTMVDAFNLSEKYQVPVIMLTDQSLAHRTQSWNQPDLNKLKVIDRKKPTEHELQSYKRFQYTEDGISPMSIPGMPGGEYVATGLEHTELGNPSWNPKGHSRMTAKRVKKVESASKERGFTKRHGHRDAKVGIICWGSTIGAAREAVKLAESERIKAAVLHVRMVYPLPCEDIREFMESVDVVVVPELNATMQFASILRSRFNKPIVPLGKVEGLPFKPAEILKAVKEVAEVGDSSHLQDRSETDMVPRMR